MVIHWERVAESMFGNLSPVFPTKQVSTNLASRHKRPVMQIRNLLSQIPITLLISAFVIIAPSVGELSGLMTIDFRSITAADLPRVFTCHLLHWSWNHLLWDLAMFTTLGAIAETNMPRRYRWTLLLSALLIPAGVVLHHPEMETYRGLSGIDTAIFGLIVADLLGRRLVERDWNSAFWFSLLLLAMLGKMLMETFAGTNLFVSDTSFIPLPVAHLIGAVTGLVIGAIPHVIPRGSFRRPGLSTLDGRVTRSDLEITAADVLFSD